MNKTADIAVAVIVIVGVCLFMASINGCEDKEVEALGIDIDAPITIDVTTGGIVLDGGRSGGIDSDNDPNDYLIILTDDWVDITGWDEPLDISFCIGNTEVVFTWDDGKFDVIYDPNDLTKAAETFFECIKPYLNEHIEEAAKAINERAGQ